MHLQTNPPIESHNDCVNISQLNSTQMKQRLSLDAKSIFLESTNTVNIFRISHFLISIKLLSNNIFKY